MDFETIDYEYIWIELTMGIYSAGSVYRPPNAPESFWQNFEYSLEQAFTQTSQIVTLGDIDIDVLSMSTRHPFASLVTRFNLDNLILTLTRYGPTLGTLLDVILVSESCKSHFSSVNDVHPTLSDHHGCEADITVPFPINTSFKRDVWVYKRADYIIINTLIVEINWDALFDSSRDIDHACVLFTDAFLILFRQCIPLKTVTIRPNYKP